MRRAGILVSGCVALCAACSLTTSLDGYAGPADTPTPSDAAADGDGRAGRDATSEQAPGSLAVTSLAVVEASSAQTLPGYEVVSDGMQMPPPSTKWTLRADVIGEPGSVSFVVDGADFHIENAMPYYLCGDKDGGVAACALAKGAHVLRVTPVTGPDGTGAPGQSLTLTINVP